MDGGELPTALLALLRKGRLDYWGAPYDSLDSSQLRKRFHATRHEVLWFFQQEWDRNEDEIRSSARGEEDTSLLPGLIDFAGDGYGNRFCLYPEWAVDGVTPVVLAIHDELESSLYATSFEQALVRGLLEYFAFAASEDEDVDPSVDAPAMVSLIEEHVRREDRVFVDGLTEDPSSSNAERLARELADGVPPSRLEAFVYDRE
jgi:hypothetical protein